MIIPFFFAESLRRSNPQNKQILAVFDFFSSRRGRRRCITEQRPIKPWIAGRRHFAAYRRRFMAQPCPRSITSRPRCRAEKRTSVRFETKNKTP